MAQLQYEKIYDKMKASGELLMHLDWFAVKLQEATIVPKNSNGWIRIDSLIRKDEDIFRYVAFSSDWPFGRDSAGNIYVTKDHALNIHE
jgi:hypothetical protein